MTVPRTGTAASNLDKVRAGIAGIEVELAAVADVQTGSAKGGIESSTSHWAKRLCEQPFPHGRSESSRSTQESSNVRIDFFRASAQFAAACRAANRRTGFPRSQRL
jgi:hypothetical protein